MGNESLLPVAPALDEPLEMLEACHQRIEQQLNTLERLRAYLPEHGADETARRAAQGVLRYFRLAGPNHHADEEQDLFPALLESMAGSDAVCLRELVASLSQQHRELESHWHALRPQLQRVAAGDAAVLDAALVEGLVVANEQHLAREEAELLPMAARLIGDEALQEIGRAMRQRRGIPTTG